MQLAKLQESFKSQTENYVAEIQKLKANNINSTQITQLVQERESILNGLENALLQKGLELHNKEAALQELQSEKTRWLEELKKLQKQVEEGKNIVVLLKKEHQLQSTKREEAHKDQITEALSQLQDEHELAMAAFEQKIKSITEDHVIETQKFKDVQEQLEVKIKDLTFKNSDLNSQVDSYQFKDSKTPDFEEGYLKLKLQVQVDQVRVQELEDLCQNQSQQLKQQDLLTEQLRNIILNLKTEHEQVKAQLQVKIADQEAVIAQNKNQTQELQNEHDQVLQTASNAYQSELNKIRSEGQRLKSQMTSELETLKYQLQEKKQEVKNLIQSVQQKEDELILRKQEHKQFVISSNKDQEESSNQIQQLQLTVETLQNQIQNNTETVAEQSQLTIHQLEREVALLAELCEEQQIQLNETGCEVKSLHEDLDLARQKLKAEMTKNSELVCAMSELQEKFDSLQFQFDQADSQRKELLEQLEELNKKLEFEADKSPESDDQFVEPTTENHNKAQSQIDSRIENSLLSFEQPRFNELADLEERMRSQTDEIAGLMQTVELLRSNIVEQSEKVSDLQTQLDLKVTIVKELELQLSQADDNTKQQTLLVQTLQEQLVTAQQTDKVRQFELNQENQALQSHFQEQVETIQHLTSSNSDLKLQLSTLLKKLQEENESHAEQIEQLSYEHEDKVAEIQQQHQQVQADLSKYLSDLEALTVVKQTAINEVEAGLRQTRTKLHEQALQHQAKVTELQTQMKSQAEISQRSIEQLEDQLNHREKTIIELESKLAQSELQNTEKQKLLEEALAQVNVAVQQNQVSENESKKSEFHHKMKITQLETKISEQEKAISDFRQECDRLSNQLQTKKLKEESLKSMLSMVQNTKASFSEFKTEICKVLQDSRPQYDQFSHFEQAIQSVQNTVAALTQDLYESSKQNEIIQRENHDQITKVQKDCEVRIEQQQQITLLAQNKVDELTNELDQADCKLGELQNLVDDLTQQKETISIEKHERETRLWEELNANYDNLKQSKEQEFRELCVQVKQILGSLENSDVTKRADALNSRLNTLKIVVQEAQQNVANKATLFIKDLEIKDQSIKDLQTEIQVLAMEMDQRTYELTTVQGKLDDAVEQLRNLENQNKELRDEAHKAVAQAEQARAQVMEDSLTSQKSLIAENAQLLERLQRVESVLKETREKQTPQSTDSNFESRISEFEKRLDQQRNSLTQTKQEILYELGKRIEKDLHSTKQAYIEDRILTHGLNEHSNVKVWNDIVQVVSRLTINEQPHLVVQTKDDRLFIVNKNELHEAALSYLQSYAQDNTSQLNLGDENAEMASLQELITELCRDLAELHLEFAKASAEHNGGSKAADLSMVGMKDEVEFLAGENRDLRMKVKQLSASNAQLKLQIISLTEINLNAAIKDEEGYIEAARNISYMADEDPYTGEENKEQTDFLSDQESFGIVVKGLSKLETSTERRLEQANSQIEQLKSQLKQKNDQSDLEEDTATTISHIKGTLIQFLKTTPFTEKQNEELLKIVFSMMEFSPTEITELQNARMLLKGNNKAVVQSVQNSSSRVNTSGVSSEGEKKVKKGILGLFQKTKTNQNNSATIGSTFAPPQQPVKR